MPLIDEKSATRPNASGPYSRVIIGDARMVIIWAITVPVTRVSTSLENGGLREVSGIGSGIS